MKGAGFGLAACAIALCLSASASAGKLTVGAGSAVDLGTGSLALGCADLEVAGTFTAGPLGFSGAGDVAIAPGGILYGSSSTLSLSGDWNGAGIFYAGAGTVEMIDGCGLSSGVIAGDTQFKNLSIGTSSARLVRFTAGSVQTVTGLFSALGTVGNRLQLRSTLDGIAAYLTVTAGNASFVDVQDLDAQSGSTIPLTGNSLKGPNTPGWVFGVPVPLLGSVALGVLALALLVSGRRRLVRARPAVRGGGL
jgi:hypothetical protein